MNKVDFVQAERILRVESPLGADQLLAQKLTWREGISELFEGRLWVRSKQNNLTPQSLLGKPVDVSLELGGGARRAWNAIVTDMIAGPLQAHGMRHYELLLRPDLWLLSQTSDCRIWLNKTSIDIANELLGEHGIPAPITAGVVPQPEPHHYSVQWNESDLGYLTRRLEADGLFFWWSHTPGGHQMHIASHPAGYEGGEDVRFAHGSTDLNHINRFETRFHYVPGKRAARDWNFQTPGTVPEQNTPSVVNLPKNSGFERFEYPIQGGYGPGGQASERIESGQVERLTKLRMQADEAEHRQVEGASNTRTLGAGRKFTPYDQANPGNRFAEHVVVAIEHQAIDASYETGGGQPDYTNHFIAIPADVPATPQPTTPLPRIEGTQVALVAGPPGEEIHPDKYGRIKLWFPWDRRAKKDGSDTCWVRVMQNWAGAGWGGQVIPRIGMEVMVSYLDGDPDRPVVTGVVPNEAQKVPYPLPENKTKSVFRTDSHKSEGFNEISFEDATGEEDMFFHAQKDQTIKVLHNRAKRVENDQVESVGSNKSIEIGNNHQEKIGGSMNLSVGGGVGSAIFGALAGLMGTSGAVMRSAADDSGDAFISAFSRTLEGTSVATEATSLLANTGFNLASEHRAVAGAKELAAATALGSVLSRIMPISGIRNTIIEKAATDTIGLMRTEQIGVMKNTYVGKHQNTVVGQKQNSEIGEIKTTRVGRHYEITAGEDFTVTVGKSQFIMTREGTIILRGVRIELEGERQIRGQARLIDWN